MACESVVPIQKSNLTVGMIKSQVKKGITSQTDLLNLFGAPNLVTTNTQGKEVWSYNKSSYSADARTKRSYVVENMTTSSLDFVVTFSEKNIVEDYKVVSAAF